MRVSSFAVARPAYYDRNATSYVASYVIGGTSPHAQTTRITTTVAAGKKLLVEALSMYVFRDTVGTVAGGAFILPQVTSGATSVFLARSLLQSNVASANYIASAPTQFTIYAGETFFVDTLDTTTGGTVTYVVGAKGTTFDA